MAFRIAASELLNIDARRICVIKPSALGDVVQTLPVLGALRRRFPDASIAWVIRKDLSNLLVGHRDLDEVIEYDRKGSWLVAGQLLRSLSSRRFDLVFDLQGLLRTGVMHLATGARWRVGLKSAREGSALACNIVLPDSGRDVPAYRRYWRVAEALGVGEMHQTAHVPVTLRDTAWRADVLAGLPEPLLAIHAGAVWETKRWPVEKFAEVARRFPGSVVAVGSAAEQPLAADIVEAARGAGRPALNLAGRTTLLQLASVLQSARLVLSNDSGPMHLAAAMGTPVVGVFTCTSPLLSGPPPVGPGGLAHEFVATQLDCGAGYHRNCPLAGVAHLACLSETSVERVWRAVVRLLDRQRVRDRSA